MEDRETQLAELQRRLEDLASSHGVLDAQALAQVRAALQGQIGARIAAGDGNVVGDGSVALTAKAERGGRISHLEQIAGPKIQVIVQPAAPPPDAWQPIVVFVSSDDEMAAEREAVHRAIDSLPPLHRPWLVELTSSWRRNSAFVSQYIRRCEIFVMLLGEDLSGYLEEEQQWALENRSAHLLPPREPCSAKGYSAF